MATDTLALSDAIMKDLYVDPVRELVNYKTWFLDKVERDSEHIDASGKRAIIPVHLKGNLSPTSIAEGGTLPTPGIEQDIDAIVYLKDHAGGVSFTDKLIKQAKKGEGAFINKLDRDSKLLAQGMKKRINQQLFGDGLGTLAVLATSPAAAVTFTVNSTQYLKVGQVIDVRTVTTGALENAGNVSLTISGINRSTKVVTVSGNVTATTGTAGVYLAGAYGLEMEGLRRITATGRSLHGIDSSTAGNEGWNGHRRDAAGATAGEGLFEELADEIGAEAEGEVEWFLTTRGVRRRLADTYQSAKRFNDAKAVEIHGGYTAIYVNEIPVMVEDDAPKGWAFAGANDAFLWEEIENMDWLKSEDGTVWHLAAGSVAGTRRSAWEAWMVWYAAFACVTPNRTGAIINCADDA
jgi:hypothetical protein